MTQHHTLHHTTRHHTTPHYTTLHCAKVSIATVATTTILRYTTLHARYYWNPEHVYDAFSHQSILDSISINLYSDSILYCASETFKIQDSEAMNL